MDLIDHLRSIAARLPGLLEHTKTEEATKHALVLPFINALGYNAFDPTEVLPEYTCDVGTKKGEKVDYAIMRDGQPIMLIECKQASSNLDSSEHSQLLRYFHVSTARVGVLTNGLSYRFYMDIEETNKLDAKPFLEFNIQDIKDGAVEELKRFTKGVFNADELRDVAIDLKQTKEIKRILGENLISPSEAFVQFFAGQIYSGKKTQKVLQQFTETTRRAFNQFISERITERLKTAMEAEGQAAKPLESVIGADVVNEDSPGKIVTTEDEIEAFHIVKSIAREIVNPSRVTIRDSESYCAVLLDDNNRKTICRFRFGVSKKSIGIIDDQKCENRVPIQDLNDIYSIADQLKQAILAIEKRGVEAVF